MRGTRNQRSAFYSNSNRQPLVYFARKRKQDQWPFKAMKDLSFIALLGVLTATPGGRVRGQPHSNTMVQMMTICRLIFRFPRGIVLCISKSCQQSVTIMPALCVFLRSQTCNPVVNSTNVQRHKCTKGGTKARINSWVTVTMLYY